MIDDQKLAGTLGRYEFQPEFWQCNSDRFAVSRRKGRRVSSRHVRISEIRGRQLQMDIENSCDPGFSPCNSSATAYSIAAWPREVVSRRLRASLGPALVGPPSKGATHLNHNRLEPPCTDPYARWCGRGRRVTAAPMPSVPSMFDSSKVKVLFTT
jgi:hypothetical protein